MPNLYRVRFHGEIDVRADSELEAECSAAFDCGPENCEAELIEEDEEKEAGE